MITFCVHSLRFLYTICPHAHECTHMHAHTSLFIVNYFILLISIRCHLHTLCNDYKLFTTIYYTHACNMFMTNLQAIIQIADMHIQSAFNLLLKITYQENVGQFSRKYYQPCSPVLPQSNF